MALENMLSALRKRKHHGKLINESTVQRYLSVVSAVLSDAKRNEIIEKNPARMLDLPTPQRTVQRIPTRSEVEKLLDALAKEPRHYRLFYLLSMYTGCRSGATPAVRRACSVSCVKWVCFRQKSRKKRTNQSLMSR